MIGNTSNLSAYGRREGQRSDGDYVLALDDFRRARKRAAVSHVLGRLRGQSLELLSFREVTQKLKETGRHDLGVRDIPVKAIVGSVGRTTDFDRDFLPLHKRDAQRWARVKVASMDVKELPPIEVYKIGESYFVSDGNHRVSIAREQGVETMSASVIEVQTRAPLPVDAQPDDLILATEYADFLEYTQLDKLRPEADLRVSVPGQYKKLENHIAVHRCYLEADQIKICRTTPEAARYWYDEAYLPVVESIRERGMLREFPGCTETDFYLWIVENQEELRDELGWSIDSASVISSLAGEIGRGSWPLYLRQPKQLLSSPKSVLRKGRKKRSKWMEQRYLNRYSQYLFSDILVPFSWQAGQTTSLQGTLSQALIAAIQEQAQLLGLAISEEARPPDEAAAQMIRETFEKGCQEAGVEGTLAFEEGNTIGKINERASLSDLIVFDRRLLSANSDPQKGASDRLRSLKRANRPVLLAGQSTSPLKRILLALDGRSEIGTTLFLATYLAERWGSNLILLSESDRDDHQDRQYDRVQRYLDLHEVAAGFIATDELVASVITETADAQASDLIVSNWPATGRIIGRTPSEEIELLIDICRQPILICP